MASASACRRPAASRFSPVAAPRAASACRPDKSARTAADPSRQGRTIPLTTLKKRAEFLRIRGGARWATPSFVLEAKQRDGAGAGEPSAGAANPDTANAPAAKDGHAARFGFTVTKKLGNSVHRNRIRRRLKAAVTALYAQAMPGCDYVVVARNAAFDRDYPHILSDLQTALTRVNRELGNPGGPRPPSHRGGGRGQGKRPEAKGGS